MRRALAVLALTALAGCSSSSSGKDAALPGTSASPTTSTSPSTTSSPGASPSAGASAVPGASTAGSASPAATTAAGSSAPSASAAAAGAKATAPGTYTYDSSGTQTISGAEQDADGTSTLTVSEVIEGSQSTKLHNSQGDTEQDLVVRSTGSFLASLTISSPTMNKEFQFSPPALLFPDPAKAGATWSWTSTSTDGSTKVTTSNKVLRTQTLTVGGERVSTVVLQSHVVITGKDLSYTADATNWVAPTYRLPVKTHTEGKGSYGAFPFSFDVTDVVRSVHPS